MTDQRPPARAPRVLVVEDEGIVALDVAQLLAALGWEVTGTVATAAALNSAAQRRPDVALVDIVIRGQPDGVEAARRLRQRFGVAIVFATGVHSEPALDRAKAIGPAAIVSKPYTPEELDTTLRRALRATRPPAAD